MAKKDAVQRHGGSLLPIDRDCPCPKKSGPGLVTFLGCSGCRYYVGMAPLWMAICSHPGANYAYGYWYDRNVEARAADPAPEPEPPAGRHQRDEPGQLPLF